MSRKNIITVIDLKYPEVKKSLKIYLKMSYQYRRYYVRENKSNCCPTLTANMGGGDILYHF